jgi:predicted type IV restriction endonuclease
MFKIPKKVSDRLVKEVSSFQRVLQGAKDRDVNETDTVTIIKDILAHVFGFDKYTELTSEQCIRGTFCDLAVKVTGKIQYLIEVKAVGLDLKDNHIRQAVGYGASEGIPWVVLTNGITWEIYRIKFEQPVTHELACTFNLLTMNPRSQEEQCRLFLLCREGLNKAAIDEFYERQQNVNRFAVGAILLTKTVLDAIRKEMKIIAPGNKVGNDEIEKILVAEVIKRDVLEGDEAAKIQSKVKKCAAKKMRAAKETTPGVSEPGSPAEPQV